MARRRSGRKIDFTHWAYASGSFAPQGAGTAGLTLLGALHLPETILRMRGYVAGYIDAVQSPGAFVEIGMGLILVPEGTGTTVTWSPITDGDAPWVWASYFLLGYEEMVANVVDVPVMTGFRDVIDNKAMRVVQNKELQLVIENATIGIAANVNAGVGIRVLSGT